MTPLTARRRDVRIAMALWEDAARNPSTLHVIRSSYTWQHRIFLPPLGRGPGELIHMREHEQILELLLIDATFRQNVADVMFSKDRSVEKALQRANVLEEHMRTLRTWVQLLDPHTNMYYFWNRETNDSAWTLPDELWCRARCSSCA